MTKKEKVDYDVGAFLDMYVLCRDLHILPREGGLFDQDALFVHLYSMVSVYVRKREELDQREAERANRRSR